VLAELFRCAQTGRAEIFLARLLSASAPGALEGIMFDAIAEGGANLPLLSRCAGGEAIAGRRAWLRSRTAALTGSARRSPRALCAQVFQPVQPMLAQPAEGVADALGRLGTAAFEWKLDGARVQAHKSGDEIRVYTRSLNDVTPAVPEIVAALVDCAARESDSRRRDDRAQPDGTPYPFQETMRRFGRKLEVEALRATFPLSVFFFDCLLAGGKDLTARPAAGALRRAGEFLPAKVLIPRLVTGDKEAAQVFYEECARARHEGVRQKALDAPYEAGSRAPAGSRSRRRTRSTSPSSRPNGAAAAEGLALEPAPGRARPATGDFVMLARPSRA